MNLPFVADGEWRIRRSPELLARLRVLRTDIAARHAEEFAATSFAGRCRLRWRMAMIYWRERRLIIPSPASLYVAQLPRIHPN